MLQGGRGQLDASQYSIAILITRVTWYIEQHEAPDSVASRQRDKSDCQLPLAESHNHFIDGTFGELSARCTLGNLFHPVL
jgi:hypothetical protein